MIAKNRYRSVDCGELRINNVGQTETLSGFVDTIRKLGGITFVCCNPHVNPNIYILNANLP